LGIAPSGTCSEEPPATVHSRGATPPCPGCREPRQTAAEAAAINPAMDCAARTTSWPLDLAASVKSGDVGGRRRARVEKERPAPSQSRGASAHRRWPMPTLRPWAPSTAASLHVAEVGNQLESPPPLHQRRAALSGSSRGKGGGWGRGDDTRSRIPPPPVILEEATRGSGSQRNDSPTTYDFCKGT
jgi:hypothetical protein